MSLNVDITTLFNPWITDSGHIGGVVVPLCVRPNFVLKNKPMREFHSLKLPWASSDRNRGALRLLFHSAIGFHNLTDNISTAKPRYAQGLLRYDNACFNDYADN